MTEGIAIKEFVSKNKNVFSLKKKQKIAFHPYNDKWLISTINGTTGYVPKSFLSILGDDVTIKKTAANITIRKNENGQELSSSLGSISVFFLVLVGIIACGFIIFGVVFGRLKYLKKNKKPQIYKKESVEMNSIKRSSNDSCLSIFS